MSTYTDPQVSPWVFHVSQSSSGHKILSVYVEKALSEVEIKTLEDHFHMLAHRHLTEL